MMQAIKHMGRPVEAPWYVLCTLGNQTDAAWYFDRFRISGDTSKIKIGIIKDTMSSNGTENTPEGLIIKDTSRIVDIQPFHSGGGWTAASYEHDFSFNLTGGTAGIMPAIVIQNLDYPNNKIYQVYASPTGYSATRNKFSDIDYWDYRIGRITYLYASETGSSSEMGRLRADNNYMFPYEMIAGYSLGNLEAQEVDLDGVSKDTVHHIMTMLVNSNLTDGTLNYTATLDAGYYDEYNTLISRNWIINGPVPSSGDTTAPTFTTALSSTFVDSSSVSLSWASSDNISVTGQQVEYKTSGGSTWNVISVGSNDTSYTITGLRSSTTFDIRIKASDSASNSTYSNTITETTLGTI